MANTSIQLKKSGATGNTPADLQHGEVAINYADGKLYYKNDLNSISFIENQDSFSTINVNSSLVLATSPTDILTILPGTDTTVTACTTTKTITIGSNSVAGSYANSAYTHANSAFEKANTYPGNSNQILYKNSSNVLTSSSGLVYDGVSVKVNGNLESVFQNGDEGGEIFLNKACTNTTLVTGVTIDIYQNKLRFFESGGTNRGVYIDMANGATGGVGTNLLSPPGGSVISVAGASGTVSNTQLIAGIQTVSSSYGITFDYVATANNGQGTNFKVGDDAWIGDYNVGNAIKIKGQQDASNGYISFGSNTSTLGVAGAGQLTYGGNTVWHAGNDGVGSGLDADFLDGLNSSDFARVSAEFYANSAFISANSSYNQANTATTNASTADSKAVTAGSYANSAYTQANTATTNAATADNKAVTAGSYANSAYNQANTATTNAAGASLYANGAFIQANAAYNSQNTTGTYANTAFDFANSAGSYANSAFTKANNALPLTGGTINGSLTVTQDVSVTGNLVVLGNTTSINTTSFTVQDTMLILGLGNYTSDILDIGFASHYNNGSNAHTGIFRDASEKQWMFFEGYTPEVSPNNDIVITDPSFKYANVRARDFTGNLIANTVVVNDTNLFTYTTNAYTQANTATTNALAASTYANSAYTRANNSINANTGGTITGNTTVTGNLIVTNTTTSISNTTGALIVSGGIGVTGNVYIGSNGALGFSNTTSTSVVFVIYNQTTNSLDTIFG